MADELKPCPFCGGTPEFIPYKRDGLTLKCAFGCPVMNYSQRTKRDFDWLRRAMTERWNTRAGHDAPAPHGGGVEAIVRGPSSQRPMWAFVAVWDGKHFVTRDPIGPLADHAALARAEADAADARRWRTLIQHFKRDHIWHNVMGSPDRFDTIEGAIDAVAEAGTWEVLHSWAQATGPQPHQQGEGNGG